MPPRVGALGLAGSLLQSLHNALETGHSRALEGGGAWGITQLQTHKQSLLECPQGWGHSGSLVEKVGVSVSNDPCSNRGELGTQVVTAATGTGCRQP